MKVWLTPNQALDPTAPLDAEEAWSCQSPIGRSEANPQAMHRTLRGAVHAYARDPSQRNAVMVEATVEALRRQRTGSRS